MEDPKLYRNLNHKTEKFLNLRDLFAAKPATPERWLFIMPHDDDAIVGAGLLLLLASKEIAHIDVLITSDGSSGYCDLKHRDDIAQIRRRETLRAFALLGIDQVSWLGFPDNLLHRFAGRWRAAPNEPGTLEQFTGLQNAYTHYLRKLRPTRLFISSSTDIHPDHQVVHREVLISIFHALGGLWPELGAPLDQAPEIVEMPVYCGFCAPPDIKIVGAPEHFAAKLQAISEFQSQKQIASLVDRLRAGGPVEYFRTLTVEMYDSAAYSGLFQA